MHNTVPRQIASASRVQAIGRPFLKRHFGEVCGAAQRHAAAAVVLRGITFEDTCERSRLPNNCRSC